MAASLTYRIAVHLSPRYVWHAPAPTASPNANATVFHDRFDTLREVSAMLRELGAAASDTRTVERRTHPDFRPVAIAYRGHPTPGSTRGSVDAMSPGDCWKPVAMMVNRGAAENPSQSEGFSGRVRLLPNWAGLVRQGFAPPTARHGGNRGSAGLWFRQPTAAGTTPPFLPVAMRTLWGSDADALAGRSGRATGDDFTPVTRTDPARGGTPHTADRGLGLVARGELRQPATVIADQLVWRNDDAAPPALADAIALRHRRADTAEAGRVAEPVAMTVRTGAAAAGSQTTSLGAVAVRPEFVNLPQPHQPGAPGLPADLVQRLTEQVVRALDSRAVAARERQGGF